MLLAIAALAACGSDDPTAVPQPTTPAVEDQSLGPRKALGSPLLWLALALAKPLPQQPPI
jgi:hypothetical protein